MWVGLVAQTMKCRIGFQYKKSGRDYRTRMGIRPAYRDGAGSSLLVRQADSPTTELPAPSTIAILGLGLLGLVARRKLF